MAGHEPYYWKDWRERLRGALPVIATMPGEPRPGPDVCGPSRRDFLRAAGFALAGAGLAGCMRPDEQHAVPYLVQPDGIVAGNSYYYASVCGGCSAGCGLLIKNRDGRPIKLEGNPDHPLSRGGLCAVGQASLLGLYDRQRLSQPSRGDQPVQWAEVNRDIRARLQNVRGPVRFLTGPLISPTTRNQLQTFLAHFPETRHVVLDPRPGSAIVDAHQQTHGARLLPHYRLDRADVIVSFDADFLGTWISPVEFTSTYQAGRRVDGTPPRMSYHVQFESRLSLTGSKADQRLSILPGELGLVMSHLAARLADRGQRPRPPGDPLDGSPVPAGFLDHLADKLLESRRRSLILCGSQDVRLQVLTNFLNDLLDNYGTTLDLAQASQQVQDSDRELRDLLRDLHEGRVGALFIAGCNPVHDLPEGETLAADLRRVPLLVCCSQRLDETTSVAREPPPANADLARFLCPESHSLESWGDAEPINGLVSLMQPAINPLGNTRTLLEMLAAWTAPPQGVAPQAAPPQGGRELLLHAWQRDVFPRHQGGGSFQAFWDNTLQQGFARVAPRPVRTFDTFNHQAVRLVSHAARPAEGAFSLVLYAKVGMFDARHAYNPWLHELPDPISKVTWDNYACLSPASAARLGVRDGQVVRLETTVDNRQVNLQLPAFVQPGLHDAVVAIALGYGSQLSRRFADIGPRWLEGGPTVGPNGLVGQNAALFLRWQDDRLAFTQDGVSVANTGRIQPLASTQGFHQLTVPAHLAQPGQQRRPIIHETTLAAFRQEHGHHAEANEPDLWPPDHEPQGRPQWGMLIDLNACTGCSACVIACQVENNVPVVGKDEVRRHREMHWLRLDRYYSERGRDIDVVQQPMLCQHCENAPCEVVCPVLATVHSAEGVNQQVYNRCVGTRYCANNCPYKVRRFNWFDYAHEDALQNLALNPDVTVRTRGVMEKCTFCIQRIQEARSEAASRGVPIRDEDLQTACQQSCPAQAIVFGNQANQGSKVARQASSRRVYQVLEELNVRPRVRYLSVVRNRPVNTEGQANG
jgi:molybdopterin-containing oxidoreductase family iron-sulfur binding subunit